MGGLSYLHDSMSFLSLHGRAFTILLCSLYRAQWCSALMCTHTENSENADGIRESRHKNNLLLLKRNVTELGKLKMN